MVIITQISGILRCPIFLYNQLGGDFTCRMYWEELNSLSIQQLRKQMLISDTDDMFRVWEQIDIIDICGAGYHFNYIDFDMPDYDYLSAVNKIACANEYNFNYF